MCDTMRDLCQSEGPRGATICMLPLGHDGPCGWEDAITRADLEARLTSAVLVNATHAEQVIKNEAIRAGGFRPTTQRDALNAMRRVLLDAAFPPSEKDQA